jgi:hypothetical protein
MADDDPVGRQVEAIGEYDQLTVWKLVDRLRLSTHRKEVLDSTALTVVAFVSSHTKEERHQ